MARSRWKLVYFEFNIWRKIKKSKKRKYVNTKPIIFSRKSTVPSAFFPFIFTVDKGKIDARLVVSELNIGYKFGEFSFTRKPYHFPMRRTNQKNNVKKRR